MTAGLAATPTAAAPSYRAGGRRRADPARLGPLALVAAVVAVNLVVLHQEASVVSTLNDSSFHEQMVRYATLQFDRGHFPLDGWFPYLGLGSPLFLHYQSLGAMVAGLLGLVIGPDHAFSLLLYLLLSLWPICIYLSARLLGLTRWQAAAAALVSPLLTSVTNVGYEQISYLWVGYGVWAQLFGMWMLPLSWGFSARAVRTGRGYAVAVLFASLTIASHFLSGYLTAAPLLLLLLCRPGEFRSRLRRVLVIGIGAALSCAWLIVPLEQFSGYASVNEFLQGTASADSYGARQVLIWLFDGSLFDSGHFLPVLTVLVGGGLLVAIRRWRADETTRLLALLFVTCLVLFFGRPTLGPLIDVLPGSRDLFLRRFLMGVQLSGIYLSGVAITAAVAGLRNRLARTPAAFLARREGRAVFALATVALALTALAPSWSALFASDSRDGAAIRQQIAADASEGGEVGTLVAQALALGPGRFFAGMPNDSWGPNFAVGEVPVFKYLANFDVDIVGYTLRTASLMTDPEAYFDEYDPGDYPLFGVRYLILPLGRQPSPSARHVATEGPYALWEVVGVGYLRVVDTQGSIAANRANIGENTADFVRSTQPLHGPYPVIAYGATPVAPTTVSGAVPSGDAGRVLNSEPNLEEGRITGTVDAIRPAVVVFSASFDPGWVARVDGAQVPTEMVAPALVAVPVGAGRHRVSFTYAAPGDYPQYFSLAGVTLVALVVLPRWRRRRAAR